MDNDHTIVIDADTVSTWSDEAIGLGIDSAFEYAKRDGLGIRVDWMDPAARDLIGAFIKDHPHDPPTIEWRQVWPEPEEPHEPAPD